MAFATFSQMPRYYFHDGSVGADGIDLPDDASARTLACETLGGLIRDATLCAPGTTFTLRVTDEDGRGVAALTFIATI